MVKLTQEFIEQVKTDLYKKGETIYSFSRLMSLKNCMQEYKFNYIDHINDKRGNIWSELGTLLHDSLEKIYKNELDPKDLQATYFRGYDRIIEDGYKFPSQIIHDNTTKAIAQFLDSFKKQDYEYGCECENLFLIKINGHWLQGYVDLIVHNEDGSIDIYDYKVSSKFTKQDLKDKGKQLTLYAVALQKQGYKINKLKFNMLKYVNLKWKIGRKIDPLTERKDIWKNGEKNQVRLLLACKDHGMSEDDAYSLWLDLYNRNTLDIPQWLYDYVEIEDGYVEWEFNDQHIQELKDFIDESIAILENETKFAPVKIDKSTVFYCQNLCSHRGHCPTYLSYLNNQPITFESNGTATSGEFTFDDLFSM